MPERRLLAVILRRPSAIDLTQLIAGWTYAPAPVLRTHGVGDHLPQPVYAVDCSPRNIMHTRTLRYLGRHYPHTAAGVWCYHTTHAHHHAHPHTVPHAPHSPPPSRTTLHAPACTPHTTTPCTRVLPPRTLRTPTHTTHAFTTLHPHAHTAHTHTSTGLRYHTSSRQFHTTHALATPHTHTPRTLPVVPAVVLPFPQYWWALSPDPVRPLEELPDVTTLRIPFWIDDLMACRTGDPDGWPQPYHCGPGYPVQR